MLSTCKRTEIPPKPSKKEHTIIEVGLVLIAANLTPFVTSIIPVIIPCK